MSETGSPAPPSAGDASQGASGPGTGACDLHVPSIEVDGVAVIGAGPAGLMAAEAITATGVAVEVFDSMPSAGRKFLLAGRGGLNITHSEPIGPFLSRYGQAAHRISPLIGAFDPEALRQWVHGLGIETFVGSSGRVFPREMKAAPLLRAWLHRLRATGVRFRMRHRWAGWDAAGRLQFEAPQGMLSVNARAVVLALGGASWPRLGSDGTWVAPLEARGVPVTPLRPANCGFDLGRLPGHAEPGWSAHFLARFAGRPLKTVAASADDAKDWRTGDFVITDTGIEGTLVYALSAALREAIGSRGGATLRIDLNPGRSRERLADDLARPRGGRSFANHLRARAGIDGIKAGLLREALGPEGLVAAGDDASRLADAIKSLPLPIARPRPLDEAISTAGGVRFEALDDRLMLSELPGVFCAGEMLDWEAPTGGYLLTACLASGRVAGAGAARFVQAGGAWNPPRRRVSTSVSQCGSGPSGPIGVDP